MTETSNDFTQKISHTIANIIPIACHYNQHTLITKNGELIQVIKIGGFANIKNISAQHEIRNYIRAVLEDTLIDPNLAIYMHVMRDRKDISLKGYFNSQFASSIEHQWIIANKFKEELVNTLYITVIHKGLKDTNLIKNILTSPLFNALSSKSLRILDKAHSILDSFVQEFSSALEIYDTKVLNITIDSESNKYISELISFFYKILHLNDKKIFLLKCDASEQIATNLSIKYNFNNMIFSGDGYQKRYVIVYTMKYPYNLESQLIERILQTQQEMMLTETIVLSPENDSTKMFNEHMKTYRMSNSEKIANLLNLGQILQSSGEQKQRNFCEQQITITLYGTDEINLKYKVANFHKVIKEIGVSLIREDLNMATVFFSQIPGNFRLITRQSYNNVKYGCNFSLIHYEKIGSFHGSKWGAPITVIRSVDGMPYFFNFHHEKDNGNTLIYGTNSAEARVINRFLLAQATRLNPRIISIFIENERKDLIESFEDEIVNKIIIRSIDNCPIKIDILDIETNFYNQKSLFVTTLTRDLLHSKSPNQEEEKVANVLDHIISEKIATKRIEYLEKFKLDEAQNEDPTIQKLISFFNSNVYTNLFSEQKIPKDIYQKKIVNIDISSLEKNIHEVKLLISILLASIAMNLDKEPTIIALNNANFLFQYEYNKMTIENLLITLSKRNAILLASITEKNILKQDMWDICMRNFTTKLLLSDRLADKKTQKALDLSDYEFTKLKNYDKSYHAFLIKQENTSVFCSFDITQYTELNKMIGEI